jgi:hypothetical protein
MPSDATRSVQWCMLALRCAIVNILQLRDSELQRQEQNLRDRIKHQDLPSSQRTRHTGRCGRNAAPYHLVTERSALSLGHVHGVSRSKLKEAKLQTYKLCILLNPSKMLKSKRAN